MLTIEIKVAIPRRIWWYTLQQDSHQLHLPAWTFWHSSGKKCYEAYQTTNQFHRIGKPAVTRWHSTGQKDYEYYWEHGKSLRYVNC